MSVINNNGCVCVKVYLLRNNRDIRFNKTVSSQFISIYQYYYYYYYKYIYIKILKYLRKQVCILMDEEKQRKIENNKSNILHIIYILLKYKVNLLKIDDE